MFLQIRGFGLETVQQVYNIWFKIPGKFKDIFGVKSIDHSVLKANLFCNQGRYVRLYFCIG